MIIAVAGPNGAGKSTFYWKELASAGFTFVNADEIAKTDRIDAYEAARRAAQRRSGATNSCRTGRVLFSRRCSRIQ